MIRRATALLALALVPAVLCAQQNARAGTPSWNVEDTHGPTDTVRFETSEGTWMNLDVSPDGTWIVFDLLGDIYRMPFAGGRATLLSGGNSWEHQPRISPDGRTARDLLRAVVPVQLGAHGQFQGLGAHWELWMLAQGGLSNLEALRAATIAGARYIGLDQDLGSIEPGKLADLVVIDGNPVADIRQSERVLMVMKNGVLYDADLNEVWPETRPAATLRWRRR